MPVDVLEDAMSCDPTAFRYAMRRLASSVALVTCGTGTERRGLTATAICSVCAEPPAILACVNRSTQAHDVIEGTGRFCINLLGRNQMALAETFAGRRGLVGLDRFTAGRWQDSPRGSGPLLMDGVAWLDCRVIRVVSVATHTVFLGVVEDTRVADNASTLAYCDGSFISIDVGRSQDASPASTAFAGELATALASSEGLSQHRRDRSGRRLRNASNDQVMGRPRGKDPVRIALRRVIGAGWAGLIAPGRRGADRCGCTCVCAMVPYRSASGCSEPFH